jgi:cbb3-type cytochrome oxidase subunit 3
MLEIFGETIGTIIMVLILGGVVYAFYWILKYMLDGIRKSDD